MDDYQSRKQARTERYNASQGVKQVPCVACNGSGHYDANNSPKCGSCGGTGKVPEREALAREQLKTGNEKAREAVIRAGVTLHPRIAKLRKPHS